MSSRDREKQRQYDREYKRRMRAKMTPEEKTAISDKNRAYRLEWYQKNKRRVYDQVMDYRRRNPEKVKLWAKRDGERQRENGYKAQKECHQRRLTRYRNLKDNLACSTCGEA